MKYLSLLTIAFTLLTSSFVLAPSNDSKGIDFKDISFDEALALAKKENKLVFLDAYAVWCGPCKMMDRTTFKSEQVGALFNKNFINIKIDMEKGEGPALAKKYQVTAYPTFFVLNPDGKMVKRIIGYMGESQLIAQVQEFVN